MSKTIYLVANGDLRPSANQKCWPVQAEVEAAVIAAVKAQGHDLRRGHDYDPAKKHGFIDSQKRGIEVFRTIPEDAPLVVVEAVWQYSQHLMAGLLHHKGPILTVANWSGNLAWLGGPAQPQRLAAQGRQGFRHAVERGLQGPLLSRGVDRVAEWQADQS